MLAIGTGSQIELRVAALVSQDQAMFQAYENGEDLHRKTAATILHVAPEAVTREQRQMAKAVNFGLLYGQGPTGLARSAKASYAVDMTEEEAKLAQQAFFEPYPDLRRWQKNTADRVKRSMSVTTPGGRVRDFSRESKGYSYTQALNTPIQGGAAEVMLATLACLTEHLGRLDAKLVNIVHDELVLEVAEGDVEAVKVAVEKAMVKGMLSIFPEATTRKLIEVGDGQNWAESK